MENILKNGELENLTDNSLKNALLEIFEQINTCNEICYQTIHLALLSSLEMLKNRDNREVLIKAIEQFRNAIDKCRNASDKIDRLSHSGIAITVQILDEKNTESII
jgi:hypothetical protein